MNLSFSAIMRLYGSHLTCVVVWKPDCRIEANSIGGVRHVLDKRDHQHATYHVVSRLRCYSELTMVRMKFDKENICQRTFVDFSSGRDQLVWRHTKKVRNKKIIGGGKIPDKQKKLSYIYSGKEWSQYSWRRRGGTAHASSDKPFI